MSKRSITTIVMIVGMSLWLLWDIYVAVTKPGGDTISEITLNFWVRYPQVLFLTGYLCGHLFWPQFVRE